MLTAPSAVERSRGPKAQTSAAFLSLLPATGGGILVPVKKQCRRIVTVVFGRLTGISTGLGPPILIRSLAGFFAALATKRLIGNTTGNKRTQ